jgi:hypothetical protein
LDSDAAIGIVSTTNARTEIKPLDLTTDRYSAPAGTVDTGTDRDPEVDGAFDFEME